MSMRRIFCPVDFLDSSWIALKTAYDFAVRSEGVLILMHAFHLDLKAQNSNLENWEENVRKEHDAKMDLLISQLIDYKPDSNVKFEKLISKGFAVDRIIDDSADSKADLIVLNSKGSSGFADKVAGSISTNVIESTQTPVLIIPVDSEAIRFDNVVVSCQPEMIDKTDFKFLGNLANLYQSKLTCLTLLSEEEIEKERSNLTQKLETKAKEFDLLAYQHVFWEESTVDHDLDQYVHENKSDLLVMVRGKKNFWEKMFNKGNTRKMTAKISYPLLILQETN
jgi:nucleotide-binding universal stress UspA family protein